MSTQLIMVYHRRQLFDLFRTTEPDVVDLTEYQEVATLTVEESDIERALETVFVRTQNIERPWREHAPCRSTSVGDVMIADGVTWLVERIGFRQIGTR